MRLRDGGAGELLAPVVVMALAACEIELALPALEERAPCFRPFVPTRLDRHAARLARDVGGEREQLAALVGEGRGLLPLCAAAVDLLLEVHRAAAGDLGVARGHAFHGLVAARAGGDAVLALPQRLAVHQPEEGRVGVVVVLHGARIAPHELVARAALAERNLPRLERHAQHGEDEGGGPQETLRLADCVSA